MSRSRHRLHLTKIDDFAEFCEKRGYTRTAPISDAYEVLRLTKKGSPAIIAHARLGAKEHATLHGKGTDMFNSYIAKKRNESEAQP